MYTLSDYDWKFTLVEKIHASDAATAQSIFNLGDSLRFGISVSMFEHTVLVGATAAHYPRSNGNIKWAGKVYSTKALPLQTLLPIACRVPAPNLTARTSSQMDRIYIAT